jgi:glycosyltransferase involved in cell wall biosynthesis
MEVVMRYMIGEHRYQELPPGIDLKKTKNLNLDTELNLIYVGGINPPLYDIKSIVDCVEKNKNISLSIICRKDEFQKSNYIGSYYKNITFHHFSKHELEESYLKTDLALIILGKDQYLSFAMPVKLFESFEYGKPVIISKHLEVASKLVEEKNLGYLVSDNDELGHLLNKLARDKSIIEDKQNSVAQFRNYITWSQRALEAKNALLICQK